jgi:hypothetical protein
VVSTVSVIHEGDTLKIEFDQGFNVGFENKGIITAIGQQTVFDSIDGLNPGFCVKKFSSCGDLLDSFSIYRLSFGTLGNYYNYGERISKIAITNDKNYFFLLSTFIDSFGAEKYGLIKFDFFGNEIWSKVLDNRIIGQNFESRILVLDNSEIVILSTEKQQKAKNYRVNYILLDSLGNFKRDV